jgi:hypothetical protein
MTSDIVEILFRRRILLLWGVRHIARRDNGPVRRPIRYLLADSSSVREYHARHSKEGLQRRRVRLTSVRSNIFTRPISRAAPSAS